MKIAISLLLLLSISTLSGCNLFSPEEERTDLEKLPAATNNGKQTFGCLVNGNAFIPYTQVDVYATFQGGILQIRAEVDIPAKQDPFQYITFVLIEQGTDIFYEGRTYELSNPPTRRAEAVLSECTFFSENIISGSLSITKLDRNNLIISGTFQFTAQVNGCDNVSVTDGRFDIKYVP